MENLVKKKAFILILGTIYFLCLILFNIGFFVVLPISIENAEEIGSAIRQGNEFLILPISLIFNQILAIIFCAVLYWNYHLTGKRFFHTFSILAIHWSIVSDILFYQITVMITFFCLFIFSKNDDAQEKQIIKENINPFLFAGRSATVFVVLSLIFFVYLPMSILQRPTDWEFFPTMIILFPYQFYFKALFNQMIDSHIFKKQFKTKKTNSYLTLAVATGQFWYPLIIKKQFPLTN